VVNLQARFPVGEVRTEPLSQISSRCWQWHDVAIESCWRWRWHYLVDVGRGMMSMLSHPSDGAADKTWPRCNVNVESCW
jgi:hypothetical protein